MTTPPAASPRPGSPAGFTLIELMVVCAILGTLLLLVPPSLDGYGARGRLEQGANMIASAVTGARDTAIIDGHATILELDLEKDRFRFHVSSRMRVSNLPVEGDAALPQPEPDPDEEWIVGNWYDMPQDVDMSGYSEAKDMWETGRATTVHVNFTPEGIVRPAHAVRVESRSLPRGSRTMTVRVNALTSLSEVIPGEAEMPEKRDPNEFR